MLEFGDALKLKKMPALCALTDLFAYVAWSPAKSWSISSLQLHSGSLSADRPTFSKRSNTNEHKTVVNL